MVQLQSQRSASRLQKTNANIDQHARTCPGVIFTDPFKAHSAPGTLPEVNRQGCRPTTHCAHCLCKPTATTSCRDLGPPTQDGVVAAASTLVSKLEPHYALLRCMFVGFVGRPLAVPVAYYASAKRSDFRSPALGHWPVLGIILGRGSCSKSCCSRYACWHRSG